MILCQGFTYLCVCVVLDLKIVYLGFSVTFNTAPGHIKIGREEPSIHSWSRFCTANCQTLVSNSKLTSEVGGRCVTTVPPWPRESFEEDRNSQDDLNFCLDAAVFSLEKCVYIIIYTTICEKPKIITRVFSVIFYHNRI